jgi:hypothetical protein
MSKITWKRKVDYVTGQCQAGSENPNSNGYISVLADQNPKGHDDPPGRITITDAERADGAYIRYESKHSNHLKLTGIAAEGGSDISGLTVTDKDGNPLPADGKGVMLIQDTTAAPEGDISYYITGRYDGVEVWSGDPVIHNQEE